MFELKRLFKRHIEENLIKYIMILALIAGGILLGFIFSKNISPSLSENLSNDIGLLMDGFSEGTFDRVEILKTSFLKNLRISLLIFVGGLSVWLLPISFAMLMSHGFSLGFTIGYLALNFGGKGLAISVVSMIFVLLINIPSYIFLGVIALNNSRYKKRGRSSEGNFGIYAFIFGSVFLISTVSVLADGFLIPNLISLICR